jgi:hypothetical protein
MKMVGIENLVIWEWDLGGDVVLGLGDSHVVIPPL